MSEQDVIELLKKQNRQVPSAQAVERCIATLPPIKKRSRIMPLIRLQLQSLPWMMYLLSGIIVSTGLCLGMNVNRDFALVVSGLASALVGVLLGWHMLLSEVDGMSEIEQTCRYCYSQILLSRLLCLMGLSGISALAVAIPVSVYQHGGIAYCLVMILPTTIGALAALLWANYIRNSDLPVMVIYLVSALLTCYQSNRILNAGLAVVAALTIACFVFLVVQGHTLMNRRIKNEAYSV